MNPSEKSVVTCDLEGRIETYNAGAASIFGYEAEEVVGKKRVSLFSPGEIVLEHVPRWLRTAVDQGEFQTRTVFVKKDGTSFAADIRITPTFKLGQHIGYCGVTVPLADVSAEEVRPKVSTGTRVFRWLVVTRAPFLTASITAVLLGAAFARASTTGPFAWANFWIALLGSIALHLGANTFNDYFDWTSGTDQQNSEYFLPFSGGSRSIELGLITEKGLLRLAITTFAVAAACGAALVFRVGSAILGYGLAGAFAAYFYTAPPLRLAARKGLGELFVGLAFGPLMTAGMFTALTGRVDPRAFATGVLPGLLTAAILYINEFPDAPSDERAGKSHLVVVLGKRGARWGYAFLLLGAAASLVGLVVARVWPPLALIALLAAPLGISATRTLWRHYDDRELVSANKATILLQLAATVLATLGLLWGGAIAR